MKAGILIGACVAMMACATSADLVTQADRAQRSGDHLQAHQLYRNAVCEQGHDLGIARSYVEAWGDIGRPGNALVALERCPLEPVVRAYILGLSQALAGDHAAADQALAEAYRDAHGAQKAEVAYRRGLVAVGGQRWDEALVYLEDAAGRAPERAEIRLAVAQTFLGSGDLPRVLSALRGILSIEPREEDLTKARSLIAATARAAEPSLPDGVTASVREILSNIERGEVSNEDVELATALASRLNHPRVLTVAGTALLSRGRLDDAQIHLGQAAALNPFDPVPQRTLGLALAAAEHRTQAIAALRMAFERDPFDANVAQRLAEMALAQGDLELTREAISRLTVLQPKQAGHLLQLARVERRMNNFLAARRALERGVALGDTSVPTLLERATVEAALARSTRDPEERKDAAERAERAVAALLDAAPGHPAAEPLLRSIPPH